jgi:glutathione S-transferase
MLALYGKSSSINVRKVLWLCTELDLAIDQRHHDGRVASADIPGVRALNPNALVPVLRDGDFVLWESNSICRYLAARQRRTDLLPDAPQARALVEQWMDWQATDLNAAWRYAFLALVRDSPAYRDAAAIARSTQDWHRHMGILDAQLQRTGAYAAGAHFTLADIVLGLSTQRWMATPMQRPPLPAVAAYYERLSARPGFLAHGRNGMP